MKIGGGRRQRCVRQTKSRPVGEVSADQMDLPARLGLELHSRDAVDARELVHDVTLRFGHRWKGHAAAALLRDEGMCGTWR